MQEFLTDIFNYQFLQNAFLASLLSGISCGIVGTYMVIRRMIFLGGGITHSSFGGVGLAYYLGFNTTLGALFGALVSALLISSLSVKKEIREDTSIGILWSLGMAIGIIFIVITPGYAPNLMSFLFGNILLVGNTELISLFALNILLVFILCFWYKLIICTSLDNTYAKTLGVNTTLVSTISLIILSITIVLNIKVIGIMLLISLLTIPTAIAGYLTNNYKRLTILSILFATLGLVCGIIVSYYFDIPAGAISVIILGIMFIPFYLFSRNKK